MGWKIDVTLSLHSALVRPQTAIEKIPHDHQEALPYSDQVLAEVAQKSRWIFHFGDIQKPSGHGPGNMLSMEVRGVDTQRCFPTSASPWFCKTTILSSL